MSSGPAVPGGPSGGPAVTELHGRIMPASNATFLGEAGGRTVVYKPVAGERPLWDFPDGTLADREVAAHAVSEVTGWDVVPHTWLGDGPHGPGMVQEWQEPETDHEAVSLVRPLEVPEGWRAVFEGVDDHERDVALVHEDTPPLRRMAVFDVLVNNADRKGGHVLVMPTGHRYGVDHGLTLHHEPKLRTVLWGWHGEPLAEHEVAGIERVVVALYDGLADRLADHLTDLEVDALADRCHRLLERRVMPSPGGGWPPIPWPPF